MAFNPFTPRAGFKEVRAKVQTMLAELYSLVGGGVITDHGALSGLADDDHTQYHNDTRGDARYPQLSHTHSTYLPKDGSESLTGNLVVDRTGDATTASVGLIADTGHALQMGGIEGTVLRFITGYAPATSHHVWFGYDATGDNAKAAWRHTYGAETSLFYDGTATLNTVSGGIDVPGDIYADRVIVESVGPYLELHDTNATADEKIWFFSGNVARTLRIQAATDAGSGGGTVMDIVRTAASNNLDYVGFGNPASWTCKIDVTNNRVDVAALRIGGVSTGSAALANTGDFATSGHNHTGTYQPLDTQLTDLAGLSYTGNALKVVRVNAGETGWELVSAAGGGDVVGPSSSVASEIALYDGTTGKLLKRAATTGLLKAASGVLDAAVAGTDYARPFVLVATLAGDQATAANTTPVTLTGLVFSYEANATYRIWAMGRVAPTAATTGCGFQFDLSSAVTAINVQFYHQLASTGTLSGGHSIADDASVGVSSGMPGTSTYPVTIEGLLVTGANTGTAQLRFRSETTAVTTCKSGFTLVVERVA